MREVPGSGLFELDNITLSPPNALVSYLTGIVDEEGEKGHHARRKKFQLTFHAGS